MKVEKAINKDFKNGCVYFHRGEVQKVLSLSHDVVTQLTTVDIMDRRGEHSVKQRESKCTNHSC